MNTERIAGHVRVRIRATFERVMDWDEDDFDVPINDIIDAARETPNDWAVGEAIDGELVEFTIEGAP